MNDIIKNTVHNQKRKFIKLIIFMAIIAILGMKASHNPIQDNIINGIVFTIAGLIAATIICILAEINSKFKIARKQAKIDRNNRKYLEKHRTRRKNKNGRL